MTDLGNLRLIVVDQLSKAEASGTIGDQVQWADLLKAVDMVASLDRTIGSEWLACLRCGMAFPTDAQHSDHYWKAHR